MNSPWLAMKQRLESEQEISESAYCDSLLKGFEFIVKYTTSVLLGLLPEDNPVRYQWEYTLVRASSIGQWQRALQALCTGSSYSRLSNRLSAFGYAGALEQIATKRPNDSWQHRVATLVVNSRNTLTEGQPSSPAKRSLLDAVEVFVNLRNKADAHGAPRSRTKRTIAIYFDEVIDLIDRNLDILAIPLLGCRPNLVGGPPSVVSSIKITDFDRRRYQQIFSTETEECTLYLLEPVNESRWHRLGLVKANESFDDFYLANGRSRSRDRKAEWLSYTSGRFRRYSIDKWSSPPPVSETSAYDNLESRGSSFTNAPELPSDYIDRLQLQDELADALVHRKSPIITLNGRGGIGKTSLALWAVREACTSGWFDIVLWFSSRDIDLTASGALDVRPDVTSFREIVQRAVFLLRELGTNVDTTQPPEVQLESVISDDSSGSILWILDNFETVDDPKGIYLAFDEYINYSQNDSHKVVITTRHRTFRGDYPIQVDGMSESEFGKLISQEAISLHLDRRLPVQRVRELYGTSDGHPYVAKIILGEIKRGKYSKARRILQSRDDVLGPLFERTVDYLDDSARHIYFLLCRWHSFIPFVALDLAVNGNRDERIDILRATEDLKDFSLVTVVDQGNTDEEWIWFDVPTPSRLFGRHRLQADPSQLEIDVEFKRLQRFGVSTASNLSRREDLVWRFWKSVRSELEVKRQLQSIGESLGQWYPWFDRLGNSVPWLWNWLARELVDRGRASEADKFFVRAIRAGERMSYVSDLWLDLAKHREEQGRDKEALQAWVSRAALPRAPFEDISHAANKVNGWLGRARVVLDKEERQSLVGDLIEKMDVRLAEADAQDLSRLAWLYANVGQIRRGLAMARRGLDLNPRQKDCANFFQSFEGQPNVRRP